MKTDPNQSAYGYGFTTSDGSSHVNENGVSKREYFAGIAMQGLLSSVDIINFESESLVSDAVRISDELINALNK